LLTYSEQFQQTGSWSTAGRLTVGANTADTTDPLGGNTAEKITETTDNGTHRLSQLYNFKNDTYTFSCYMKKGTRQWVWAGVSTFQNPSQQTLLVKYFDLDNTALGSTSETQAQGTIDMVDFVSASITDVGNGWKRCSVVFTIKNNPVVDGTAATFVWAGLASADGTNSYAGTTSDYGYIWGAQLERGSSVSTYEQTVVTPAIWSKLDVTAVKDQTGIDGVANSASKITATADGGTLIQQINLTSGSRTGSVYLKRITGTGTVQVSLDGSTYSTVDLSDTECRRIVLSGTVTNPTVGIKIATNGDAVAMDYAQVEDGAFATTPILTTTATVTRSADFANIGGVNYTSFFRADEGSLYAEILKYSNVDGRFAIGLGFNGSNYIGLLYQTGQAVFIKPNIATTLNPIFSANTFNKVFAGYKTSDYAATLNGLITSSSGDSLPGL
jgi:hypothetical protein